MPGAWVLFAILAVENGAPRNTIHISLSVRQNLNSSLPVLIHLNSDDANFAGVNTNGNTCAIRFITLNTINMDDPFLPVNLRHFPLPSLVLPPHDPDFVVFTNRERTALYEPKISMAVRDGGV